MSALKTAFKQTISTLFEISSRFKIHNDGLTAVFKSLRYIISSLKRVVFVKQVLKCPYHQFFMFLSDSIYHPMNFCGKKQTKKKTIDLNKMQSFLEVLKCSNWPPFWSTIRTSLPLV